MKTIKRKIGKNEYQVEQYESVLELTRTSQKRVIQERWKSDEMTDKVVSGDKSFYGVKTMDEAYNLLSNGWEEQTKKVASLVDKVAKTGVKSKTIIENSVEGFIPNVPLSLLNVPQSMINMRRVTQKSKVINVLYDASLVWSVTPEEALEAGLNVVNTIVNLEMSGYRVDLSVICFHVVGNSVDGMLTKVKNANQALNLKKMMFPIAHCAWLRVIGFDWQNKCEFTTYDCGRGKPYYRAIEMGMVKSDDLKQIVGDNTVYINYKMAKEGSAELEKMLTQKK